MKFMAISLRQAISLLEVVEEADLCERAGLRIGSQTTRELYQHLVGKDIVVRKTHWKRATRALRWAQRNSNEVLRQVYPSIFAEDREEA